MPALKSIKGFLVVGLSTAIVCMAVGGCGSSDAGSTTTVSAKSPDMGTVAKCLAIAGATLAKTPEDLSFLQAAEDEESVSKVGLRYERSTKQIVRMWSAATLEKNPPEWTLWFGQPANSNLSPHQIVNGGPQTGFVMYSYRPNPSEQRKIDACFRIDDSGSVNFHPVHRE